MKNWFAILAAILLLFTFAAAENIEPNAVTIYFDANETIGYRWNGYVAAGDSVLLESFDGAYVADPNPAMLDGVGGKTYFTLIPVQPGESIVLFSYLRPWEIDVAEQRVLLATVDEQLQVTVMDVTEGGMLHGTVASVDAEDHSVLLNTELQGDVIARFDEDQALPVVDEQIIIYTNGAMTMSLPPIVNVIAWSTVPTDLARNAAEEPVANGPDLSALAVDGGALVGVTYTCSGDELGNTYQAAITWTEDGTLVLSIKESEAYNMPVTVTRYSAADDTLARIAALVNDSGMKAWAARPDYISVEDAAHPYLILQVVAEANELEDASISGYIQMTDEEHKAYAAVLDILLESEKEANLLERYEVEQE